MSSEAVIKVENLSKAYTIWSSSSARLHGPVLGSIGQWPFLPTTTRQLCRRLSHESFKNFYALSDVSFEVRKGESVGIIGLNGSGKSTLLQVLAGTLEPTKGAVKINGRVAALLELGSGFNPEFTGRENVILNATILGLKPSEIEERFPRIAEFADIGEFIEQPVKTYSSGMVVRLAFAVLTQVEPDILVIDEALAVGDFLFQQKCYDCLREFQRRGCTFLFVSHAMNTVLELCSRAILLEKGRMTYDGPSKESVSLYEAHSIKSAFKNAPAMRVVHDLGTPQAKSSRLPTGTDDESKSTVLPTDASGVVTDDVELHFVRVLDQNGQEKEMVVSGDTICLSIGILCKRDLRDPHVGFKLRDYLGRVVFETNTLCMKCQPGSVAKGEVLVADFVFALPLSEGDYSITVGVAEGGIGTMNFREALLYLHGTKTVSVLRNTDAVLWGGVVNLAPKVRLRRFEAQDTVR